MSTYRISDAGEIDSGFVPPTGDIRGAMKLYGSYLYFATSYGNLSPDGGMTTWKYGRLNATTGTLDEAWSPSDAGNYDANSIDVDSSGNVVLGVSGYSFPYSMRPVLKFLADGSVDGSFSCVTFGSAAPSADSFSVLFQDDGKIVVGGQFSNVDGDDRRNIVRLNADGSYDNTLAALTAQEIGYVNVLVKDSIGYIWAGSQDFYDGGAVHQARVLKINPSGSYESFDLRVYDAVDDVPIVTALAVDSDGRVYVGGRFHDTSAGTADYIIRLTSDGTHDTSFAPVLDNRPVAIKVRSDGNILVAGLFTTVNGETRLGQVLLTEDGDVV